MKIKTILKDRAARGFTLIELLVSVAIFALVATMAIAAVLSLINSGEKAQTENSVMSNLNVALEDMSRTIRTGSHYSCPPSLSPTGAPDGGGCNVSSGGTQFFQFEPAGGSDTAPREVYGFDSVHNRIEEWIPGASAPIALTADEVHITDVRFYVFNGGSSTAQPRVLMTVLGYVQTKTSIRSYFNLQTTMTQRIYGEF
jgi:prepilin-type N-terminal cleavage/methylation domain-containing protein